MVFQKAVRSKHVQTKESSKRSNKPGQHPSVLDVKVAGKIPPGGKSGRQRSRKLQTDKICIPAACRDFCCFKIHKLTCVRKERFVEALFN